MAFDDCYYKIHFYTSLSDVETSFSCSAFGNVVNELCGYYLLVYVCIYILCMYVVGIEEKLVLFVILINFCPFY